MRIRLLSVVLMTLWGAAMAHATATTYLSLGDSLSRGVQPSLPSGKDADTNQGYVDAIYATLRPRVPGLELVKLGCSGETTLSMIQGGAGGDCSNYPSGSSQLDAAVNYLLHNKVHLVTLDIGANDIDQCIDLATSPPTIEGTCVTDGLEGSAGNPGVGANLTIILTELQWAIRVGVNKEAPPPIVAMNYYDPLLAALKLVPGPNGVELATASLTATTTLNNIILEVAEGFHVPVADVADAYLINNTTLVGTVPLDAWVELTLTWIGAPPPFGPDVHPNAAGYLVIAGAFADKIR